MTSSPIQTAVETRERKPAEMSSAQAIKSQLSQYNSIISGLLPKHITVERFAATIGNACRTTPELLACDPITVVAAALKCAQLGLEPNDTRNLAWILPYGGKASFQLGYGGVLELARRAFPGTKFNGSEVYPNDVFDVDLGASEPLRHKPAMSLQLTRGGEAYAWYVQARFPDGVVTVQVLDKEKVEYHRGFSKQKNGKLWTESYDAAALKSCVMEAKRWWPQSSEFANAMSTDNAVLTLDDSAIVDTTTGEIGTGE